MYLRMESSMENVLNTQQLPERPYVPLPVHRAQEQNAIMILLFFSFLMISLPFGAFFATKIILRDNLDITGFSNVVWSVSAAVLTVNLIVAGYVYIAFNEKEYDASGKLIENKSKEE